MNKDQWTTPTFYSSVYILVKIWGWGVLDYDNL